MAEPYDLGPIFYEADGLYDMSLTVDLSGTNAVTLVFQADYQGGDGYGGMLFEYTWNINSTNNGFWVSPGSEWGTANAGEITNKYPDGGYNLSEFDRPSNGPHIWCVVIDRSVGIHPTKIWIDGVQHLTTIYGGFSDESTDNFPDDVLYVGHRYGTDAGNLIGGVSMPLVFPYAFTDEDAQLASTGYQAGATTPAPLWWFDASRITGVADGTPLSEWADSSGNGHDLTQPTPDNQPIYYSSTPGQTVNGLPAVWFNTDDYLAAAADASSPYSIFAVMRSSLSGIGTVVGIVGNGTELAIDNGSVWIGDQYVAWLAQSVGQVPDAPCFVGFTYDGTNMDLFIDSSSPDTTVPIDGYTLNDGTVELGATAGAANGLNGLICEAIAYPGALDAAQVAAIYSYLYDKWLQPAAAVVGGVDSAQLFGNATATTATGKIVGGVTSAQAFATPLVFPKTTIPGGSVVSAQAFGSLTPKAGTVAPSVAGIASAQAFGNVTFKAGPVACPVPGIASAQQIGQPWVGERRLAPLGCIDSIGPAICGEVICGDGYVCGGLSLSEPADAITLELDGLVCFASQEESVCGLVTCGDGSVCGGVSLIDTLGETEFVLEPAGCL